MHGVHTFFLSKYNLNFLHFYFAMRQHQTKKIQTIPKDFLKWFIFPQHYLIKGIDLQTNRLDKLQSWSSNLKPAEIL